MPKVFFLGIKIMNYNLKTMKIIHILFIPMDEREWELFRFGIRPIHELGFQNSVGRTGSIFGIDCLALSIFNGGEEKTMNQAYFVEAAQGFLELTMPKEALKELEKLDVTHQEDVEVLTLKTNAYMRLKQWKKGLAYGDRGCELYPHDPRSFIQSAFCLHELNKTEEAKQRLLVGPPGIKSIPEFYYNLACYEVALGEFENAKRHLSRAFRMEDRGEYLRRAARQDEDLKPLWNDLPALE
jgi:tetratricopeptide (TPR) repeat protein